MIYNLSLPSIEKNLLWRLSNTLILLRKTAHLTQAFQKVSLMFLELSNSSCSITAASLFKIRRCGKWTSNRVPYPTIHLYCILTFWTSVSSVKYENIKHFMLQRNNDLILQVNAQVLDNWQNKIRYNLLILYIILKLFIHKLEEKTQSNYIAFAQGNITLLSPFPLCDFGGFNSKPFVWCFEPSGH